MRDVIKKMREHMPESFLRHNIFLATVLAIMPLHNGAAVKAIFFCPLRCVAHFVKKFLKNTYKIYNSIFFPVLIYNSGIFVLTIFTSNEKSFILLLSFYCIYCQLPILLQRHPEYRRTKPADEKLPG